jgi:hypothetical protein
MAFLGIFAWYSVRNCVSVVSIGLGCRLGRTTEDLPVPSRGKKFFTPSKYVSSFWKQPSIQWVTGSFPGSKVVRASG